MKILLICDTHGKLDVINELAAATEAERCFHMGDFCTYTKESVKRFSADLLYKQLQHVPQLQPERLAVLNRNDTETMRLLVLKYRTYGNFDEYFSGKKKFSIPVEAVCGNNDDAEVWAQLGSHRLENLEILNEEQLLGMEDFLICGIGGGIAESAPVSSIGCISTEAQITKLENSLESLQDKHEIIDRKRILLTHIPPYENERLMLFLERIKPVLCLCGHTHHWDDRTVGKCRIITLPRPDRGYAVLELNKGHWNCQLYKNEVIT